MENGITIFCHNCQKKLAEIPQNPSVSVTIDPGGRLATLINCVCGAGVVITHTGLYYREIIYREAKKKRGRAKGETPAQNT